ncbi:MAG: Flp pilus assembly complex ATPase component TadA, partial [Chloroflexota bacterium]|nr:Flp pilus assembly complex ATPase component TadA [Chloroflexota bacterium]
MALRDRTLYTRRMGGLATVEPPPATTPPITPPPSQGAASNGTKPKAATVSGPVERPVVVDKPRAAMSREAAELKYKIHDRLVRELDPARLTSDLSPAEARRAVEDAVEELITQEGTTLSRSDHLTVMREVADEIVGYGPLEPLLNDDSITEVMVNRKDRIFYEKAGVLHLSDRLFRDDNHVMQLIDKIVSPLGRRIDESSPMVDARLPDGSRVNAIIPPLAVHGPSLTIRKFSKRPYTDEDLIRFGTFTPGMVELLRACVATRLNILVSGGTGSGKTTVLNVISSYINNNERIVSIEDPAEIQIKQPNWISLETR